MIFVAVQNPEAQKELRVIANMLTMSLLLALISARIPPSQS
jgi:hypothetical protein